MRLIKFIFIFFLVLNAPVLSAADSSDIRVVLHVNDGYKIADLGNSVKNIRSELGDDVEIQVVINGNAVTRLLRSNEVNTKIVQNVLEQNVQIGLCHNALANNSVTVDKLIEGLRVLKTDGHVTVINYQRKGYLYIKI